MQSKNHVANSTWLWTRTIAHAPFVKNIFTQLYLARIWKSTNIWKSIKIWQSIKISIKIWKSIKISIKIWKPFKARLPFFFLLSSFFCFSNLPIQENKVAALQDSRGWFLGFSKYQDFFFQEPTMQSKNFKKLPNQLQDSRTTRNKHKVCNFFFRMNSTATILRMNSNDSVNSDATVVMNSNYATVQLFF